MKITKVHCHKEDLQLTKPYTIAYRTIDAVENLFVFLETDEGLIGVGAGSPAPMVTGETIEGSLDALVRGANTYVLGKDIRSYKNILRGLAILLPDHPAARAALDIAIYDLVSKYMELPLAAFLGQVHKALPTSITIGIKSVEDSVAEAEEYIAAGFSILKVKTGRTVAEDVEVCAKIREAVGPMVKIRVDANQGYDLEGCQQFFEQTAALDIEFVEQLLPRGKGDELRTLSWSIRDLLAADEDLISPKDAISLIRPTDAYGIFNIKLMKCGGIAPALKIAEIANLCGLSLMWGCMDESVISISAALHAAFACPATRYLDLDGSLDLAKDLATGGFTIKDGVMRLSGGPGLGVELVEKPK